MISAKHWIEAARLRTLPLAVTTMILGHSLAAYHASANLSIIVLSILTAVSLQVLSNFSNDYGDSIHGADHSGRTGPERAVQRGSITANDMKNAMKIFVFLSLIMGLLLIWISFSDWTNRIVFLILGLVAIWAAINYTAGNNPYGYRGRGDIAVFIFFGLVTVLGSFYLQTQRFDWPILFPAIAAGCLCVAVLNVNNIRDIQSDREAGKESIPVKIGKTAAIRYHGILLMFSLISLVIYGIIDGFQLSFQWLFVLAFPLLLINYRAVYKHDGSYPLDPYLKQLALSSSFILILFSLSLFL